MDTTPDPYELVHLEFPGFNDALTTGVVFVDGRTVEPVYRWRAEQIALCHGPPMRVVDVSPAPPVTPAPPVDPAGAGDSPLDSAAPSPAPPGTPAMRRERRGRP